MSVNRALSESEFQKNLAFGQMAETAISRWLISRGRSVLPMYDVEMDTGKGPRWFGRDFQAVAPDLQVMTKGGLIWIEAKHKTVCTWYRLKQAWQTGIDLNHWHDYQRVAEFTKLPTWLLFFHRESMPDAKDLRRGCPPVCPVGLFGGELNQMAAEVDHESKKHGRFGMVYWNISSLARLASLNEMLPFCESEY